MSQNKVSALKKKNDDVEEIDLQESSQTVSQRAEEDSSAFDVV